MTKKELRELRHLDCLINSKQRQIDQIRSKIKFLQATDYSKERVQSSNTSGTEGLIVKLCDMEAEIEKDIDELIAVKNTARKAIDTVDDLALRSILTLRYIEHMTWEEIAIHLNYDYRYILKLHGKALKHIEG